MIPAAAAFLRLFLLLSHFLFLSLLSTRASRVVCCLCFSAQLCFLLLLGDVQPVRGVHHEGFMIALICIFLPSAVNRQLQKVIILVFGVAPPHAHNPARHAPMIPERSPRPLQIGLFRFVLCFFIFSS